MARRSSRKRRKQRRGGGEPSSRGEPSGGGGPSGAGEPSGGAGGEPLSRGYARSRAKDGAARAALEPLGEGERPAAVTVAGALALILGLANIVAYVAGADIRGQRPQVTGVLLYSGLMFVAAWGCFRVRYWAVLGMQALLGLAVVIFSLLLMRAESLLALAIGALVIGSAGTLFWFLVKSMARIQMPERPGGP